MNVLSVSLQYCIFVGVIFFLELVVGILAFVYKDWVSSTSRRNKSLKLITLFYMKRPARFSVRFSTFIPGQRTGEKSTVVHDRKLS